MVIAGYLFVCAILAFTYVAAVFASDEAKRHIPHVLEYRIIQILFFPAVIMANLYWVCIQNSVKRKK